MTMVVNCKHHPFDVYIGRPSMWGNPYEIGRDGSRAEVIEKYKRWIETNPLLLSKIDELQGKKLGCWCSPLPCHGDILVEILQKKRLERIEF